jgi:metal-responsive CopG/Arc/MetJ family transcriptional regulator
MYMKFGTHIRIRITKDLNDRLETLTMKTGNKSDFIRSAIKEKIQKEESHEKNRNNQSF